MLYKITCSFSGAPESIKAISEERAIEILKENVCDPFCDMEECDRKIEVVE